jgi:hypothetical protein
LSFFSDSSCQVSLGHAVIDASITACNAIGHGRSGNSYGNMQCSSDATLAAGATIFDASALLNPLDFVVANNKVQQHMSQVPKASRRLNAEPRKNEKALTGVAIALVVIGVVLFFVLASLIFSFCTTPHGRHGLTVFSENAQPIFFRQGSVRK